MEIKILYDDYRFLVDSMELICATDEEITQDQLNQMWKRTKKIIAHVVSNNDVQF
jgi:hypothetical protein